MLELGISQAQTQFTKLLTQTVIIVDKKAHIKKAVIMPYDEYNALLKQTLSKEKLEHGVFDKFAGILDSEFKIEDEKYNRVID
ncbi:MAG: type II toxin-antitoxin system Phd/YefM family antitoxin [Campylobacterota bacterium]|nr:type II toxin-antitoxin system Phd/YefM family antitoxin [Campylobacterota bacterium]